MKINEFINEFEGNVAGEYVAFLYGLMCKGYLNDMTLESCIGDVCGVRAHLCFEGKDFTDVSIQIDQPLLDMSNRFEFKLESVSDVGPSRYTELD